MAMVLRVADVRSDTGALHGDMTIFIHPPAIAASRPTNAAPGCVPPWGAQLYDEAFSNQLSAIGAVAWRVVVDRSRAGLVDG
jgi:hypothetical protein